MRAYILLCVSIVVSAHLCAQEKSPLVCVFVVDQLRQDTLEVVRPFLKGGLKKMLEQGTVYTNAYMPHAMPSTAPGHAALATGTWPKYHGIIGNNWNDQQGRQVKCDDDDRPEAAVFSPTGVYPHGKSAHNMLVDSLAETITHNVDGAQVYALSLKSRSAVFPAGRAGKAIWYDADSAQFTSSKAYFTALPSWLITWNKKALATSTKFVRWELTYPKNHPAYAMTRTMDYAYSACSSMIYTKLNDTHKRESDEKHELFLRTPQAHELVLSTAQELLTHELNDKPFLLWVGLSSFDKIGHMYGPRSLEYIDLLYKLDKQLDSFMTWLQHSAPHHQIVYVLTSDHGGAEIPEILHKDGYPAMRINPRELIKKINTHIQQLHGIDKIALRIRMFSLYLDEQKLQTLLPENQERICTDIQNLLRSQPGIRDALTYKELENPCFDHDDRDYWYQQQLYPGRSGRIIIQVLPYAYVSPHTTGTGHRTPYEYDTHIPLVFYRPGHRGPTIDTKVFTPQISSTLSSIFKTPPPSAATFKPLPHW
jgi:arylsulfatase A-like enzyme